jgi:hypothetical protein
MFNAMVAAMPIPHASALETIQAAKLNGEGTYKNDAGESKKKDWDWYQQNDPTALQNLEATNPAEFNKLYAAYWEKAEVATK